MMQMGASLTIFDYVIKIVKTKVVVLLQAFLASSQYFAAFFVHFIEFHTYVFSECREIYKTKE